MYGILDYLSGHGGLLSGALLLGFAVGIQTGLFGTGGGFIITPALNIFLGLKMDIAIATSSCQVLGASAFSLWHHLDRRFLGAGVAAFTAIGIPFGVYAGKSLVEEWADMGEVTLLGRDLPLIDVLLLAIFFVFLALVAFWLILDNFWLRRHHSDDESTHIGLLGRILIPPVVRFRTIPSTRFSVPVLILLGLLMGFLGGLLGIGGGVIMMPSLFYLVGQSTKHATRTDMMLIFTTGLFSTIFYAADDRIDYPLAAALLTGAFLGARIGSRLQKGLSGKSIRKYFSLVVIAAALMVAWKLWTLLLGSFPDAHP
ncbi:MAG: sulfite exporter TauE/SafE family protein [Planctomycetes bacterium]|nr:sulfite exporter TauE/SafE family protein [Planctomycetota bacterium]